MSPVALTRMPQVASAIGVKSSITARRFCERNGIEIIAVNSRVKAVRTAALETALRAANPKEK